MSDQLPSVQEKIQLEHQAAKLFMRAYEAKTGNIIRHIWHNEPIKPDVSCQFEGGRLDLEIAHIYGSEEEAMLILGRELTESTRYALHALSYLSVDARLLNALNRILKNKSTKRYQTQRVWLILRNAHPAWNVEQIQSLQHHIAIPEHHPFEQIWIVGDWDGASGIWQLFPKQTAL